MFEMRYALSEDSSLLPVGRQTGITYYKDFLRLRQVAELNWDDPDFQNLVSVWNETCF